jgi:hypothetical protein
LAETWYWLLVWFSISVPAGLLLAQILRSRVRQPETVGKRRQEPA